MPRKVETRPEIEVEVVRNADLVKAEAADKAALKLLIRYILEDRGAGVPASLAEESKV